MFEWLFKEMCVCVCVCVCTELGWGSFLAVASARVVRTVFVESWDSISLVIRETLLVICYPRIAVV